jgi:hypothetical protein
MSRFDARKAGGARLKHAFGLVHFQTKPSRSCPGPSHLWLTIFDPAWRLYCKQVLKLKNSKLKIFKLKIFKLKIFRLEISSWKFQVDVFLHYCVIALLFPSVINHSYWNFFFHLLVEFSFSNLWGDRGQTDRGRWVPWSGRRWMDSN